MSIFRRHSTAATPTETTPHLTADRGAPREFAIDRMASALVGVIAMLFALGGLALYDLSGIAWFLGLLVPAGIFAIGASVYWRLVSKEIALRYPQVPRPPAPPEIPKPKPKRQRTFTYRRRNKPPEELPIDDEPDEKLPGFELTEADLRAFISRACEFGLSRPNMVPVGHKVQLPSGDELSRDTYDRVIEHMAKIGWVEKRGKGKPAQWAVTRRELPRLIDEEVRR